MPAFKPVRDRIACLSSKDEQSGCWIWNGCIDKCGYGKIGAVFGETLAHRASYKEFVGPISHGLEIDHKCKRRNCVNPEHLEAVSHAENVRRGDYKSNHRNRRKTHCKRGHEFTEENTRIENWHGLVMRKCVACGKEKNKSATRQLNSQQQSSQLF